MSATPERRGGVGSPDDLPRRLRVAALVSSRVVPRWLYTILDSVRHADYAELTLVVAGASNGYERWPAMPPASGTRGWLWQRLLDDGEGPSASDPLGPVNLANALLGTPLVDVPAGPFDAGTRALLLGAQLDVVLQLAPDRTQADLSGCTTHGAWSSHFGDRVRHGEDAALFWEIYERETVSTTTIEVTGGGLDRPTSLYRAWSATNPTSLRRAAHLACAKASAALLARLGHVATNGLSHFGSSSLGTPQARPRARGIARVADLLARTYLMRAQRRFRRATFVTPWFIAFGANTGCDSRTVQSQRSSQSFLPSDAPSKIRSYSLKEAHLHIL
jgi:hypothetical protein